jgi:hypothetical protein
MRRKPRKLVIFGAVALLFGVFASATALADSPHFISASSGLSGSSLTCTFKEAGLGTAGATVTITCAANATATYECINGGQKHPQAANKETVNGPISGSGTFTVGHNGSISGTVTAAAPAQGAFTCPKGQTLVLASVTYTGVTLTSSDGTTTTLGDQTFTS